MANSQNKNVTKMQLSVDSSTHNRPGFIYAKQSDINSRFIDVTLVNSQGVIPIEGTPRLNGTRPDGRKVYVGGRVNEDNSIRFSIVKSFLAHAGSVLCDVTILSSIDGEDGDVEEAILTSSTFNIIVAESQYDEDSEEGEEGGGNVEDMISAMEAEDARVGYDGTRYDLIGENIRAVGDDLLDLEASLKEFVGKSAADGLHYENNMLYLTSNGVVISNGIEIVSGAAGGGGTNTFTVTLTNLLDERVITVPEGESVVLKFNYSSVDDEGIDDGAGIGQVLVGGIVRRTFSAVQGANEVDVTDYLSAGTNSVSIRVTNSENSGKLLPYTITLAAVYLTSSFDAAAVQTGAFGFPYTPTGLANKTMHFEIDGTEIGTEDVEISGRQRSYPIPAQSHGSHILRAWFTCTVNGTNVSSNVLYFSFISIEEGNTTPIIAITTPPLSGVEQYSNAVTKYRVYNPSSLTSAITLEVDGEEVASLTVDRTEQTWTYRPDVVGEITQTIRCGDVYVSWTQNVSKSHIKAEAETEYLALYLTSYGRSNREENPAVWENNGIKCEFENFNFVSDGWVQDEDDITVMRVTGNARLTIPYKMFAYDFHTTGKTLEFELATREVLDYDAEVLSCFSGGRGFKITAQQLSMVSEQSSLGARYKEDEHIRVSIVAEKKSENRLLLCYINGIMSGAVQYPEGDDFSQGTSVGITIGSNDCTTDVYNIRVYDNSLSRHQIVENWIADTQNTTEKLARYNRNDVYDAYGQVVISKLPTNLPYLVIQATKLPEAKEDEFICSGYFTDPVNANRSFSFVDASIKVQGTSSLDYYRKNYKLKFKNGVILQDGTTADKYQMNDDAIPTKTFTMKADVASSEGAYNVVLSMQYNDLCPYKTPAQIADSKVRQCIEGFPIVIFWDTGSEVKFLGKYNFNNDKGTEEVFGFKSGDESWEIRENGSARVGWHSADFSGDDWKSDFEARYPDGNMDVTRLKALAEWIVSTDTDQATNEAITPVTYNGVEYTTDSTEYRLAKFSAELSNYFIEDAIIFYYLYTEIFLSIDQREKNAFPTYLADEGKWIVLFYDADSSCGTDNKGNMAFDYYLEDVDYTENGDPVYNGQNSVLWKNLKATRQNEITAMYKSLRSGDISYEKVIGRFEEHQSKWPEAIFNEDMYIKYIEPLVVAGRGADLPKLQGKKEQWMKWWLYNRFRYLDSKYFTGTSASQFVYMRPKSKANIFLTSYVNMYGHVKYNDRVVVHRMVERGKEYEFEWDASGAEDAVIDIYDADMLTSLGDLSSLKVETIEAAAATHITSLKLGDDAADYSNYALTSITLGNNILLRSLDVRNCPNLAQAVDISGCTNIEEVYFDGSSITGLRLPNGGILKTLHLPATIKNLTLLNQKSLEEFVLPSYSQIETLRLENNSSVIDPLAIFDQIAANSRVRIIGFTKTANSYSDITDFIAKLDSMRGLDENGNTIQGKDGNNAGCAQVSGTIYIHELTQPQLDAIIEAQKRYPSLVVMYTKITTYTVTFRNYDDTILYTANDVAYGSTVEFVGDTPVKENADEYEDWIFTGWNPEPTNVTADMVCYAQYKNGVAKARLLLARTLKGDYTNDRVKAVGKYAFNGCGSLTSIDFPEVERIEDYAFANTSDMTSVNLPKTVILNAGALQNKLSGSYIFPSVTTMGTYAVSGVGPSTRLTFPSLKVVAYFSFYTRTTDFLDLPVVTAFNGYGGYGLTINRGLIMRTEAIVSGTGGVTVNGYIYVPSALVEGYKVAAGWSDFADKFRALEDYTVDGTITGELDETKI